MSKEDEQFVKDNIPESVIEVFKQQNERIISGLKVRPEEYTSPWVEEDENTHTHRLSINSFLIYLLFYVYTAT